MTLSFQLAMSYSPLSVASSVPSSPSFRDGWGDLPELVRFRDQPVSPPWDSDAEKCLGEQASPQPPLPTPPPSPPPPSRAPTSPSPLPRPHSTPYQVALEALEEALMCTAVPPPSPLRPPNYVPKDPPTPSKPTVHGPYTRGWGTVFCKWDAEPPSDVSLCSSAAQEKPPADVAGGNAN